MFERTIRSLEKCKTDARLFVYIATLITQSFFVLYHILVISFSIGSPTVHAVLLALTAAMLLFFLFTETPSAIRSVRMRRWVRTSVRYAKFCVHIYAIILMLYMFYTSPEKAPALALILVVLASIAVLIQLIAEIVGFVCKRYFEELLAATLADTEILREMLGKAVTGYETIRGVKESIVLIPSRATNGIKSAFSIFKRKKASNDSPDAENGKAPEGADVEA